MADVTFRYGDPRMMDYTPSGAVDAGDVIVIGSIPYVSHIDRASGDKYALASRGGVYRGIAGGDYAPGQPVYWNASTAKFVAAAATGSHKHFGYITPDSDPSADGQPVEVEHAPNGGVSAT